MQAFALLQGGFTALNAKATHNMRIVFGWTVKEGKVVRVGCKVVTVGQLCFTSLEVGHSTRFAHAVAYHQTISKHALKLCYRSYMFC